MEGRVYVVTRCRFSTHQPTGARGRPSGKVRQGPLELTAAGDADEFLMTWGATAYAPKTGHVVFYDIKTKSARETISFTAGHLVHLGEVFAPNTAGDISYYCELVITAEKFELLAGAPANAAAIRPAPGSHGTPRAALLGVSPGVEEALKQTIEPLLPLVLPDLLATAVPYVAPVLTAAAGAAGVLALILATTTPAHAPGLPVPVADPDELRLRELAGKHADGTLTAEEETELIALLAKVKGIWIPDLEKIPFGFPNADVFAQAGDELKAAWKESGISYRLIGVRGSSVTGLSSKGGPFRIDPQNGLAASDVDVFIELLEDVPLTDSKTIPGFIHPDKLAKRYPALREWSKRWTQKLGRDITPGAFKPDTFKDKDIIPFN